MTETIKPTEIDSVITEPTLPISNVVSTVTKSVAKPRAKKVKFHAYDKSKNCRDLGKEHKYVNRGSYLKCTRCGSSRTLKKAN